MSVSQLAGRDYQHLKCSRACYKSRSEMRHRPPLVLNVPYTAGSGPKKLSIYYKDYAVTLEILCISDISGAELLQCSEPSWLPTTGEEPQALNTLSGIELEKPWMHFKWRWKVELRMNCDSRRLTCKAREVKSQQREKIEIWVQKKKAKEWNSGAWELFPVLCAGCLQANCRTLSRPEQAGGPA